MAQTHNINIIVKGGGSSQTSPNGTNSENFGAFKAGEDNGYGFTGDKTNETPSDQLNGQYATAIVGMTLLVMKIAKRVAETTIDYSEMYYGRGNASLFMSNLNGVIGAFTSPLGTISNEIRWQLEQRRINLQAENTRTMLGGILLDGSLRTI